MINLEQASRYSIGSKRTVSSSGKSSKIKKITILSPRKNTNTETLKNVRIHISK